jgi:hypothetical protein
MRATPPLVVALWALLIECVAGLAILCVIMIARLLGLA